jgi:hypothetical protein
MDTSSITLDEPCCASALHKLLDAPKITGIRSSDLKNLYSIREQKKKGSDLYVSRVRYSHRGVDFGRRFAGSGYQRLSGYLKRYLSHSLLRDLDIVNCFLVILESICIRVGVDCQILTVYNSEREQILKGCIELNSTLDRKTVKNWFISAMFLANTEKNVMITSASHTIRKRDPLRKSEEVKKVLLKATETKGEMELILDSLGICVNVPPFLHKFSEEMKRVSRSLYGLPEFVKYRKAVEMDSAKKNKLSSFLSYVCQDIEDQLLMAAYNHLQGLNIKVGGFCFDGLMPYYDKEGPFPPSILKDISDAGFKRTGIRVEWLEKSNHLTEEDKKRLFLLGGMFAQDCDENHILLEEDIPGESRRLPLREDVDMEMEIVREKIQSEFIDEEGDCDENQSLFEEDDVDESLRVFQNAKVYSTGHVRPIHIEGTPFEPKFQCTVVICGMGGGKTTASVKALRQLSEDASVLIITCRVQQAISVQGTYPSDFVNYLDVEEGDLHKHKKIIMQYESLHKLFKSRVRRFDLIILDEVRSTLNQSTSVITNKLNLIKNSKIFEHLVKHTRTLMFDADSETDGMLRGYLNNTIPGKYQVYRYTQSFLQRQIKEMTWETILDNIMKDLDAGLKIAVLFRCKSDLDRFLERDDVKDISKLVFSSDTTKEVMNSFLNPDEALSNVQMFASTTKVTVGADIQLKFDRVYVHAKGKFGACARDMHQLIGRFRKLGDEAIRVCLPPPCTTPSHDTFHSCLKEIKEQKSRNERVLAVAQTMDLVTQGDSFEWGSTPLVEILAWSLREQREDWRNAFLQQGERKQYEYVDCTKDDKDEERDKLLAEETIEASKRLKKKQEEIQESAIKEVCAVYRDSIYNGETLLSTLDRKEKSDGLDSREQVQLRMCKVMKIVNRDAIPIIEPHIESIADNANKLKRLAILMNEYDMRQAGLVNECRQGRIYHDARKVMFAPLPDTVGLVRNSVAMLYELLASCGICVADATNITKKISGRMIKSNAEVIIKACFNIAKLDGRRSIRSCGIPKKQALISLRSELRLVGMKLKKVPHKRKRRDYDDDDDDDDDDDNDLFSLELFDDISIIKEFVSFNHSLPNVA